jgi:ribosomal protein S12 methylthiotransferase
MKREPKICNYIDIPLQHISDSILKSMRRGTTQEKTTKLLKISVQQFKMASLHLIVGYQEKPRRFQYLKDWVQEMKFDRMGCLPTHMRKTRMLTY